MSRTPTPKRKPAPKLRGLRQQIALTLPPELVIELDSIAAGLERSRVKVIEFACREYVERHQRGRSVA